MRPRVTVGLLLLVATTCIAQLGPGHALSTPGPHAVGESEVTLVDSGRNERQLRVALYYPAEVARRSAPPDRAGSPYPLIVYSHWFRGDYTGDAKLLSHLATHGFVVASVRHRCDGVPTCFVDRPLDMLFVLDQLASADAEVLPGLIDPGRAGLMGISFGGYSALAANGGRWEPETFLTYVDSIPADASFAPLQAQRRLAGEWDAVRSYASAQGVQHVGEHWVFPSDPRVRAVLASAPGMGKLFGTHGLGGLAAPTLMFSGTDDAILDYNSYAVPLYESMPEATRLLVTYVGYGHHVEWDLWGAGHFRHLSTAFFGHHLQGRAGYDAYLSQDYLGEFSDLRLGGVP